MWERVRSMIIKEFIQIFRDVRMRAIIFLVPIIQMMIFGYAVTTDVRNVTTAVLDESLTPESRALVSDFSRSTDFSFVGYLSHENEIESIMDRGDAMLVLHIPYDFEKKLKSGESSPVQAIIDGADANTASVVVNYVERLATQYANRVREQKFHGQGPAVIAESRAWFNENLESRNYYVPGVIATLLTLVTLTLTSMAIVREKEVGTIEQIMVSPITRLQFMLGKMIPFVMVAYFNLSVIVAVGIFWFEIPLRGSIPLLFFCAALYLMTTLGIGFFISTISLTLQQALMSTFIFYFPAILLSGFIFPIANMPTVIQWITYLNPLRYFLVIIRGIFLKGVGIETLWPQMVALTIIGVFIQWQAARRFEKTLA